MESCPCSLMCMRKITSDEAVATRLGMLEHDQHSVSYNIINICVAQLLSLCKIKALGLVL